MVAAPKYVNFWLPDTERPLARFSEAQSVLRHPTAFHANRIGFACGSNPR